MNVLLVHEILCLIVVYTTFCRLSKTTHETLLTVRAAIWLMGTVGAIQLVAPFLWGWKPDLLDIAMLASLAFAQIATARQWKGGVPAALQKRWLA